MCDMRNTTPTPFDVIESLRTLGERIVIARKTLGMRQSDVAARAGISRSTLVEVEKGSPYVSVGNYFATLWAVNLLDDVGKIGALESEGHRLLASNLPRRVRNG